MSASRTVKIEILGDSKGARQAFADLGASTDGFGSKLLAVGKIAAIAGAAIATAVIGFAAIGVKSWMDFDDAMTKSVAIMSDVSAEMRKEMEGAARDVAKSTTFSASQAAEAYFFLASAGLDAAQSIGALPRVAAFAQAGNFDLARATDLLTDAQSALGLAADDAAENLENMVRISDVLVKANTLANASVEQFSEALTNKAGASLRLLNKDVEEGVAVLAVFADQGLKGSAAGEALSIVLRDLQRASIDNREEFDRLGVSVFDNEGNMRGMADIVGELEVALHGMSDEQRRATLTAMGFQDRSVQNIMALLGTSEAIREYEDALRDAGGTTDEVANKQLQSLRNQVTLLKSALMDVALGLGERLAPAISSTIEFVREHGIPAIERFADIIAGPLSSGVDAAVGGMTALIGIARDLATAFQEGGVTGLLRELGSTLADLFGSIDWETIGTTILDGLGGALSRLGSLAWDAGAWLIEVFEAISWSEVARTVLGKLGEALSAVAGLGLDAGAWFLDMVRGITWSDVAAEVLRLLGEALSTATGLTVDAGAWLLDALTGVEWGEVASTILGGITDALATTAVVAWDAATWVANAISDVDWGGVATTVKDGILGALFAIVDWGSRFYDWISGVVTDVDWSGLGTSIRDGVLTAWFAVTDWGSRFVTWVDNTVSGVDWSGLATTIRDGIVSAVNVVDWAGLGSAIKTGFENLTETNEWLATLEERFREAYDAATPFVEIIRDNLNVALQDAISGIRELSAIVAESDYSELVEALGRIASALGGIVVIIATGVSYWLRFLASFWGTILPPIINALLWLLDDLAGGFNQIWETLADIGPKIVHVFGLIWLGFTLMYDGIKAIIDHDWGQTWEDAKNAVTGAIDTALEHIQKFPGWVTDALSGLYEAALAAGKDLLQGLWDGLTDNRLVQGIIGAVQTVSDAIPDFIKDRWRERSPSELAREIGQNFLIGMGIGFEDATPAVVEAAARAASSVLATFDSLLSLGERMADGFTLPSMEWISDLKFTIEHAVRSIADSAAMFEADGIAAAGQYAAAGKSIMDLLGSALSAFDRETFTVPTDELVSGLKFMIEHAVRSIADSAAMFDDDGLAAATRFSDAGKAVMSLLASVPESLSELIGFEYTQAMSAALDQFQSLTVAVVLRMYNVAGLFENDGLQAAARFAEAAGKVLDIIGKGVAGIASLSGFAYTKAMSVALDEFQSFAVAVVLRMNMVAGLFDTDGLAAAVRFSESAGKILDVIGKGVDGITSLAGFEYTHDIVDALEEFVAFVAGAVLRLQIAAGWFTTEGLEAAVLFAAAADSVLKVIGSASKFEGLSEWGAGMIDGFAGFLADVKTAVGMLIELGTELDGGLVEAEAIAERINAIVGLLKPASSSGGSSGGSGGTSGGNTGGGSTGGTGGTASGNDPGTTMGMRPIEQTIHVTVEDRSPAAIANAVRMAGLALGNDLQRELATT